MHRPLSTLRAPLAFPGQTIGLFGGSFDPPHAGHVHVAETAMKRLRLDQVWWLVSPQNPLKGAPGAFAERRAAVEAIVPGPRHKVTDIESQLSVRYTAQLIEALLKRYPHVTFVWLMGADNLASFHRWQNWRGIMSAMLVAVIARPGSGLKALNGPAASAFSFAQIPETKAATLARRRPPAWVFLNARLNPLSSTALRARRS